jgi:hypothetical protein
MDITPADFLPRDYVHFVRTFLTTGMTMRPILTLMLSPHTFNIMGHFLPSEAQRKMAVGFVLNFSILSLPKFWRSTTLNWKKIKRASQTTSIKKDYLAWGHGRIVNRAQTRIFYRGFHRAETKGSG